MNNIGTNLVGMGSLRGREDNDYYATPPESTLALLEKEIFEGTILEPCCGEGHISEVLKRSGHNVISNDLINRGYGESFKDFLQEDFQKVDNIVTNPPFKFAKEFIEKSLEIAEKKVAMFCKIQLLEGVQRKQLFEETPLKAVYVFSKRQNPLRNGNALDENGKKWSSTMCFAWFVWERGYQGEPAVRWI
ncbi:class I SAM-dependent methyltransferase [Listeria monocytogenes]|uniref:class I SAM-dependent methyltransferase n=1 Tax=Listeria welshimeri TaxID=1643 RepID=UPI001887EBBE|nr:class I SAM-dependent methyltransferase [Listeria welshimeri]EAF5463421.1 class I SAM-dependent methyltransferase [Listeria monocytogenes]EHS1874586.1 class I SAM-dependent methyltransferase [Listeria monocytogenes]EHV5293036.1 class I SAM-dependent methyltransferase [Listeria monocytogenes]EIZ3974181.1 class I SAM-dependent methyltransferase [Listeria monocytogenes]EIZ4072490.1 class I SAM-dependent methyltransferase [Listeria monocytogenes]